jgi:hypothetical protein
MMEILAARSGRPRWMLKVYTTAGTDSFGPMMTTPLEKTLKRQLTLDGRNYVVAVSPEGLKITLKGKRKGQELRWSDLVSGGAALAVALNASVGRFESPIRPEPPARSDSARPKSPARSRSAHGTRSPGGRRETKRPNMRSKSLRK